MRFKLSVLLVLAIAWAFPAQAARHWVYSAAKQEWNTPDVKFRVNDWAWGDPLFEWKLVCTELKASPDEPYIRWVPAAYDTTGMTEITQKGPGDDYYIDILENVTFTIGGANLAQGSWAPRTRGGTGRWKWLRLTNADADSQGLPRGMLMVPAAYDTTGYTEDSETTSVLNVNDIPFGQYNNRGKENPNFPAGVNVTTAPWAGVREEPASVSWQGSADGPDETDGSITWSHNVSAGATYEAMFVSVFSAASSAPDRQVTAISFNGDGFTQADSIDRAPRSTQMSIWYKVSPDIGNYSVVVTRGCGGTCFVFTASSMVYEGVAVGGGSTDTAFASGTTSSATVTVTTDAAMCESSAYWDTPNQTADDGQTAIRNFPDSGPGINVVWGYKTGLASGSTTHEWSHGSENWMMIMSEVEPNPVAAGTFPLVDNDPIFGLVDGGLVN